MPEGWVYDCFVAREHELAGAGKCHSIKGRRKSLWEKYLLLIAGGIFYNLRAGGFPVNIHSTLLPFSNDFAIRLESICDEIEMQWEFIFNNKYLYLLVSPLGYLATKQDVNK